MDVFRLIKELKSTHAKIKGEGGDDITRRASRSWNNSGGCGSSMSLNFNLLRKLDETNALPCTCVGIHPGRVEPASPIELTTPRMEALQARRSCASSLKTFTQSCLHRAWPKNRGPERDTRSALIVIVHVFSWPPVHLRHLRSGVGRRIALIRSPSGRLAA